MAADSDVMVPASDLNAENFLPADLLASWIRPLIAEFIGPFALVFIGAGSIMLAYTQGYGNGGTLVMVVQPEPPTLASYQSTSGPIGQVATKVYEGLFEYDFNLRPIPGLARSCQTQLMQ